MNTASTTPTTTIDRLDIERTPGADRANSLAMITDYVPGAYLAHDQLHVRGGHQVEWLVDGVPGAQYKHRIERRAAVQSRGYRYFGDAAGRVFG